MRTSSAVRSRVNYDQMDHQHTAVQAEPGGFWIRFVASFLDGIIVGVVTFPMGFAIGMLAATTNSLQNEALIQLISMAINSVIVLFYYGYFYPRQGATPGKKLMGLKVVDTKTGEFPTLGQTFRREILGKMVLLFNLFALGYILAAVRKDKRGMHDFVGGTRVLRMKS